MRRLPATGAAYADVRRAAEELGDPAARPLWRPDIENMDSSHDTYTYAAALAHVRTGSARLRAKVAKAIDQAMRSGGPSRFGALARGRNVVGYVLAADLVDLRRHAPRLDARFRRFLRAIRVQRYADGTMVENHLHNPNNHGTMTGAGRAAIAIYLRDADELSSVARVFRGWLGERAAYDEFGWGRGLSWQADPEHPVAVNAKGTTKQGRSVDGALPEEMRRGCDFRTPPCYSHYPWEGLGGALVQAELLYRQGYDSYRWGDRALLRAVRFLHGLSRRDPIWWKGARGPHSWEPWLVNHRYGTSFPATGPTALGKNMGWTDWTHARRAPAR